MWFRFLTALRSFTYLRAHSSLVAFVGPPIVVCLGPSGLLSAKQTPQKRLRRLKGTDLATSRHFSQSYISCYLGLYQF
jgi:hypothetical protein